MKCKWRVTNKTKITVFTQGGIGKISAFKNERDSR